MKREPYPRKIRNLALQRSLLEWYEQVKRDLPWRSTSDPYRIWLSEVMLQQTRVEAVKPYYERFLRQFPTIRALAKAPEDQVLAAWSGLGYYSRAKNLQRAAGIMMLHHEGEFPKDEKSALALPGVGPYTAAAILSIAYGMPLAVLDGNVARVLSRLLALAADARDPKGRSLLWKKAQDLLDRGKPGDFNQAMMELGATVCLPREPLCGQCPLHLNCKAHRRREESNFPPARRRPKDATLELVGAIVRDEAGRYLLEKRKKTATWLAGFWQIPTWQLANETNAPTSHESSLLEDLSIRDSLGSFRHGITKYRIHVDVKRAELHDPTVQRWDNENVLWVSGAELQHFPITTITRKAIRLEQRKVNGTL